VVAKNRPSNRPLPIFAVCVVSSEHDYPAARESRLSLRTSTPFPGKRQTNLTQSRQGAKTNTRKKSLKLIQYDSKCLSCHTKGERSGHLQERRLRLQFATAPNRPVCLVNPASDCVSYHVRAVKGVIPCMTLSDHFVRVHRESSSAAGG
jgi:hypothetical protein